MRLFYDKRKIMIRDKEVLTKTTQVLLYLLTAKEIVAAGLSYPSMTKAFYPEYTAHYRNKQFDNMLRRLVKQGWLRTEYKEAKKIISLTSKGEIEAFFQKAKLRDTPKNWDGKWRLVMFDIPEAASAIRQKLRLALKSFGFKALQGSVYVYPYALSSNAITFLRKSGLLRYIRLARSDFEDDKDLCKLFNVFHRKMRGQLN